MYIIGKEEALRFVNENCEFCKDRLLDEIKEGRFRSDVDDNLPALKKALEVEGYSELVNVYVFREISGNVFRQEPETYWCLEWSTHCVRLLDTGEIARPYKPNRAGGYALTLMQEDQVQGRLREFKADIQTPNLIGVGTKSKIDAWFNALRQENEAKRQFVESAIVKNREFKERLLAKYPNAQTRVLDDGWLVECWFTVGYVKIHFQSGDDGRFYRDTKVDILALPSTDELFA